MRAHPETPARRAAQTRVLRAAAGRDEAVRDAFHGAARCDPLLAPAFAGIADWEAHIPRLMQFWCSAALMAGTCHGQPMPAHAHLGLGAAHFARWLALFEESAAARRIVARLEMS